MAEGKDYCKRKISLLKSNFDQLVEVSHSVLSCRGFRVSSHKQSVVILVN